MNANSLCAEVKRPDLTIFIDVSPENAMQRINANRTSTELYETEERLTKVRRGYFDAFDKLSDSENICIIDGSGDMESIAEKVFCAAAETLGI